MGKAWTYTRAQTRRCAQAAREVARRFPVTLACCALWTILLLCGIYGVRIDGRLVSCAFVAVPVSMLLHRLFETHARFTRAWRALIWACALGLAVFYYACMLHAPMLGMDHARSFGAFAAALALFCAAPYLRRGEGVARDVWCMLWRALVAFFFAGVLLVGAIILLFAMHYLLDITVNWRLFLALGALLSGVFVPLMLLARVPRPGERPGAQNRMFRVLLWYIVLPLLALFTLLLYIYFVRILALWQWPSGAVTPLVLMGSAVGMTLLFFAPQEKEQKLPALFVRVFPYVWLLPVAMLFAASAMRVGQYGWTPQRMLCVVAGCYVVVMLAYSAFVRKRRAQVILVSGALVLALALLGPLNVYNLSVADQLHALEDILHANDMGTVQQVTPRRDIPAGDKRRMLSIAAFLREVGAEDRVPGLSENGASAVFGFSSAEEVYRGRPIDMKMDDGVYDVAGFDKVIADRALEDGVTLYGGALWMQAARGDGARLLDVRCAGESLRVDLLAEALDIYRAGRANVCDRQIGDVRLRVVFTGIYGWEDAQGQADIASVSYLVLVCKEG
nr:DUF4153 domain-containing protein [Maliibacterium massiliense]